MKALFALILILTFLLNHAFAYGNNAIDGEIIKAVERIRDQFSKGFPSFGIPPLDPLQLGNYKINIQELSLRVQGTVNNMTIEGASQFKIDYLHVNSQSLQLELNVSLSELTAKGEYDIDGSVMSVMPLTGKGHMIANVSNILLSSFVEIGIDKNNFAYIKSLNIDIRLGRLNINLENYLGEPSLSDALNELLSSMVYDFLVENYDLFVQSATQLITTYVNENILINVTIKDVANVLSV